MSIIAARVYEKSIVIASDSICVRYYTQMMSNSSRSKLFEVSADFIVGGVGLAQDTALFSLFLKGHKPASATEDAFLDLMGEYLDWRKKKTDTNDLHCTMLIVFGGKLFSINGWFIEEINTFEAIGAGMDFALAAMDAGSTPQEAIETACRLSVFCEPPVVSFEVAKECPTK